MRNVAPSVQPVKVKPAPAPKVRTPVTDIEARALSELQSVRFCPGTNPKRFARQMHRATQLTDGQRDYLWQIVYTFRRQIQDKELVKIATEKKEAMCK